MKGLAGRPRDRQRAGRFVWPGAAGGARGARPDADRPAPRHGIHPAHGSIYILRADQLSTEDRDFLRTAARAVLLSRHGTLAEQVVRHLRTEPATGPSRPVKPVQPAVDIAAPAAALSSSSTGSAASRSRAASTSRSSAQGSGRRRRGSTSSPTATSAFRSPSPDPGFTWAGNSRENQLTPWSNDTVIGPGGRSASRPRRSARERSGARPRFPSGKTGRTLRDTGRATADSSTRATASRSTSCSSCPRTTPSRSRGWRSRTGRAFRAASP